MKEKGINQKITERTEENLESIRQQKSSVSL